MPYREMPLPVGKRAPRKWPLRLLLTGVTFAAPTLGLLGLMDFGAHVDGPGVGLFGEGGGASGLLVLAGALTSVGSLAIAIVSPTARWVGLPAGVLAFLVFMGLGGPLRVFHAAWAWQCAGGSLDACVVGQQAKPRADRGATGKECEAGDRRACAQLLDGPEGYEKELACKALGPECAACSVGGSSVGCKDWIACGDVNRLCASDAGAPPR